MKRLALCLFVLGCTKVDDVPALRDDARATVAYYDAELDRLDARFAALQRRSQKVTEVLPGTAETGQSVVRAFNGAGELRHWLADTAAHFADAPTAADLRARIDAYEDLAEHGLPAAPDHLAVPGIPAIGATLSAAEGWEAHAEAEMSRAGSGSAIIDPR